MNQMEDFAGLRSVQALIYALSRFTFESDPEFAGNDIPGIPTHVVQAEASYSHSSGLSIAPSIEWVPGDVSVNSANTVRGDGWVVLGLRAEWAADAVGAVAFFEARNLTDEVYSPTFSVDDAAGRYFQPADGRSLYAGIRWRP